MVQRKNDSKKSDYFSKIKEITKDNIKMRYIPNKCKFNLILIYTAQTENIKTNYIEKQIAQFIKKDKFNSLSLYKLKVIIYNLQIMYFIILFLLNRICSIQINPEYSYIFLKVRGTGNIKILHSDKCTHEQPSPRLPNEVYINEAKKNDISYSYSFTQSPNNITLIWYKPLNATGCMFFHCRNIIEMDLSLFKTSEITCFAGMFNGCSSLTSLNLSNFDTSQATSIYYMFKNCSSLISIDLSNFNTEKVTDGNSVFSGCSSLKYLNLKNAVLNTNFINQINSLSLKSINISYKYISYFKNQYNKLISCIKFNEFNTSS